MKGTSFKAKRREDNHQRWRMTIVSGYRLMISREIEYGFDQASRGEGKGVERDRLSRPKQNKIHLPMTIRLRSVAPDLSFKG